MDSHLLENLYKLYGREIYYYLYSLCGNASLAEDILQETFVKAVLSLDNQHNNVRAWLYLVAKNLCLNELKRMKRELPLKQELDFLHTTADVGEGILREEKYRALGDALSRLSANKKRVILLYYFEGFSLKEIAGIMRMSQENIRILSYRAKKELKVYLKEAGYEL